jgi:hypothetical protein
MDTAPTITLNPCGHGHQAATGWSPSDHASLCRAYLADVLQTTLECLEGYRLGDNPCACSPEDLVALHQDTDFYMHTFATWPPTSGHL